MTTHRARRKSPPITPGIPLEPEDLRVEALAVLGVRERKIVALRYGTNGFQPHTLREVAAAVRLGRSYVSKIALAAARKLVALRDTRGGVETEIVCSNVPFRGFPAVTDDNRTQLFRFSVDVRLQIGDREGGFWRFQGVGEPKLEEIC